MRSVVLYARDYAEHITIEHHVRQSERDAGDGGGGVIANARQRAQALEIARKSAHVDDLLRRAPQIPRARIVAQAAP